MTRRHSAGVFGLILFIGLTLAACSGIPGEKGLRDEVVTAENSAQLVERVKKELTYEEVQLLQDYVARLFPDLPKGELPSGRTIGEMIEAQRLFASGGQPTDQNAPSPAPSTAPQQASSGQVSEARQAAPGAAERAAGAPGSVAEAQGKSAAEADSARAEEPPPPPPTTAVLPGGTVVRVRLAQAISSKTIKAGETFETMLEDDLRVDGKLLAPEGSRVIGKVTSVASSGKVKGKAGMSITLDRIFVDREVYPLESSSLNFEAESTTKKDAKRIGIATGAGAIIGAIAGGGKGAAIGTAIGAGAGTGVTLATAGEEVEFATEQLFEFQLLRDLEMLILP